MQTLVWWATAVDPALLQTGGADDLHELVDRRLRTAEWMLYYVARKVGRGFNMAAIKANPTGPWETGFKRIFEYHRLPGGFMSLCQPHATTRACQAPALVGWRAGAGMLTHAFKVAEGATSYWRLPTVPDPEGYLLVYDTNGGTAVDAVDNVFTASTDFKKRNLLACDHVLHLLHIESLLHARRKRDPSTTWFQTLAARTAPADWLRIYTPWSNSRVPRWRRRAAVLRARSHTDGGAPDRRSPDRLQPSRLRPPDDHGRVPPGELAGRAGLSEAAAAGARHPAQGSGRAQVHTCSGSPTLTSTGPGSWSSRTWPARARPATP